MKCWTQLTWRSHNAARFCRFSLSRTVLSLHIRDASSCRLSSHFLVKKSYCLDRRARETGRRGCSVAIQPFRFNAALTDFSRVTSMEEGWIGAHRYMALCAAGQIYKGCMQCMAGSHIVQGHSRADPAVTKRMKLPAGQTLTASYSTICSARVTLLHLISK